METSWAAFLGVVVLAYVIPGPDFAIILRHATRGWRQGVAASLGAQTGLCVHMLLAVVGLSVVLARHAEALTVIRLLGGAYLVYLGGRLVASTFRRGEPDEADDRARVASSFRDGFLTNVTNPKAILFFASVLPQFVTDGGPPVAVQVAVLGAVDVALGVLVWAVLVLVGVRLASVLRRGRVRDWWDRVTGAVLAALGGTLLAKGT